MSEEKISRRRYMKIAAGAAIAVAAAGAATYFLTRPPAPPPRPEVLRYIGASWVMYPEIVEKYKKDAGVKIEYTIYPIDITHSKALATRGAGWDIVHQWSGMLEGMIYKEPFEEMVPLEDPVIQPIPIEKLPKWKESKPEERWRFIDDPEGLLVPQGFTEEAARAVKAMFYWRAKPEEGLVGVPAAMNIDTTGYLPEIIPYEEKGHEKWGLPYEENWNPEWSGHVAVQSAAPLSFGHLSRWWTLTGRETLEGWDGTSRHWTKADIDKLAAWFEKHILNKHIKAIWTEYGEIVTWFATKEIWISQTWQPVTMDTRRAGVPCYYARSSQGGEFWWSPDMISSKATKPIFDECTRFMNDLRLSGWYAAFITRNGYSVPLYGTSEVKETMGPEWWLYYYKGEATYKPIREAIKECWPDRPEFWELPERLQQALFLPDRYKWSEEPGTPHPKGNRRDQGGLDDRLKHMIGWVSRWPKETKYIEEKWAYLKALLG